MQISVLLTVYVLIFVAELPDKTMIATLLLGSKYRPILVWVGAVAAFTVHVTLAVAVGGLIALLPHRLVEGITAALFAAGAVYLLVVPEKDEEERGEAEVAVVRSSRAVWATFLVILIGEFGDLTQILTVNLAAKYHQPATVFVGALSALATVAAIGAFGGRALLRILPERVIRKAGGVLLACFAVYSIVTAVRG